MVLDEGFYQYLKTLVVTTPEKEKFLNDFVQNQNPLTEIIATPDLSTVQSILQELSPQVILLDLDVPDIEQMEFLLRRFAINSCILGFSIRPACKADLKQSLKLETILNIPDHYDDLFGDYHSFGKRGFLSFL